MVCLEILCPLVSVGGGSIVRSSRMSFVVKQWMQGGRRALPALGFLILGGNQSLYVGAGQARLERSGFTVCHPEFVSKWWTPPKEHNKISVALPCPGRWFHMVSLGAVDDLLAKGSAAAPAT